MAASPPCVTYDLNANGTRKYAKRLAEICCALNIFRDVYIFFISVSLLRSVLAQPPINPVKLNFHSLVGFGSYHPRHTDGLADS